MPSLRDWLEQAQDRLDDKLGAAIERHAAPDEQAGPLLAILIPVTCVIWGIAWLAAGRTLWLTGPLGVAFSLFFWRCIPGPVIPLHPRVVPAWAGQLMMAWIVLGWTGALWLLFRLPVPAALVSGPALF